MPERNIFSFDRLYRRTKNGVGASGSVVRLKLRPVGANLLRVLTHVTVENQTSAYTKCRLGITSVGRDLFLDEMNTIAADELAVSRSDTPLGEGDYFFADLTGTTTGDVLVMTCLGWDLKL